jgi:hypothetical protein
MPQRVQDKKPKRSKAVQAWVDENVAEQKKRYRAIVKEMEELWPKRKKWYREFFGHLQTTGFNVNGDMKRIIKKNELPKEPRRKHKVVF